MENTGKRRLAGAASLAACALVAMALALAPAGAAQAAELAAGGSPAQLQVQGKAPISKAKAAKVKAATYTGKAVKPKLKLTYKGKRLKAGRDYKVTYRSNVEAGTAKAVVKGKGRFKGTKTVRFKIAKASIKKAKVAKVAAQAWTGKALRPAVTVKYRGRKLVQGSDYTLSYKSNTGPGTAKVTVRGKGSLKGAATVKFKVKPPKLVKDMIYTFNSDGCQMFASNPATMYVSKVPKLSFPNGVEVTGSATVNGKPTTSYVYEAAVDDPSRGKAVVMPGGLAEAIWRSGGEDYAARPINYLSVWQTCLGFAAASETSLTEYLAGWNIDCPAWFSKALYEIDRQSYSPVGNFSSAGYSWRVVL